MAILIPRRVTLNDFASSVPATDFIAVNAYGLKSWNANPTSFGNNTAPTSQVGYFVSVPLRAGSVISNIHVGVVVAGDGTAPTTIKLGLANSAGVRKAVTANLAADAKWTSRGFKSFALSSSYTVESDGLYQVCFLQDGSWGTTAMQLARSTSPIASGTSINGIYPYGSFGTGLTDIGTPLTYSDAAAIAFWAGVS